MSLTYPGTGVYSAVKYLLWDSDAADRIIQDTEGRAVRQHNILFDRIRTDTVTSTAIAIVSLAGLLLGPKETLVMLVPITLLSLTALELQGQVMRELHMAALEALSPKDSHAGQ